MLIKVKKEHIEAGCENKQNGGSCPVYYALRCAGIDVSWVLRWRFSYLNGTNYMSTDLPPEAQDWIRDFDAGLEVKPFSFEVGV